MNCLEQTEKSLDAAYAGRNNFHSKKHRSGQMVCYVPQDDAGASCALIEQGWLKASTPGSDGEGGEGVPCGPASGSDSARVRDGGAVARRGRLRHGVGTAGLPCDDIRGAPAVRRRGGGGPRVGRLAGDCKGPGQHRRDPGGVGRHYGCSRQPGHRDPYPALLHRAAHARANRSSRRRRCSSR